MVIIKMDDVSCTHLSELVALSVKERIDSNKGVITPINLLRSSPHSIQGPDGIIVRIYFEIEVCITETFLSKNDVLMLSKKVLDVLCKE